MNFDLTDEQQVVTDLAGQLFTDLATPERVKAVTEADGFDPDLWAALADAGLLALCIPEAAGGSGFGMVELALVAQQQGRHVAPVPFVAHVLAARTIAEELADVPAAAAVLEGAIAGEMIVTSAIAEIGVNDPLNPTVVATATPDGVRLSGEKPAVAVLARAGMVLVPAMQDGAAVIALVDTTAEGVSVTPLRTTNHEPQGHLELESVLVPDELVIRDTEALDRLWLRHLAALAAVQLGVGEGAVTQAAQHVSERKQFGRTLSSFQAVSQRAADGWIVNEALWSTVINAAWQLDNDGAGAMTDVLSAAYWACEGTTEVVLGAQHLHAGIGADVDYPVHRQFLWGMQNSTILGTASSHLARLGAHLAAEPVAR
jgi:alkylation response protein AidB-like acyl-CoA dehydrogenase